MLVKTIFNSVLFLSFFFFCFLFFLIFPLIYGEIGLQISAACIQYRIVPICCARTTVWETMLATAVYLKASWKKNRWEKIWWNKILRLIYKTYHTGFTVKNSFTAVNQTTDTRYASEATLKDTHSLELTCWPHKDFELRQGPLPLSGIAEAVGETKRERGRKRTGNSQITLLPNAKCLQQISFPEQWEVLEFFPQKVKQRYFRWTLMAREKGCFPKPICSFPWDEESRKNTGNLWQEDTLILISKVSAV